VLQLGSEKEVVWELQLGGVEAFSAWALPAGDCGDGSLRCWNMGVAGEHGGARSLAVERDEGVSCVPTVGLPPGYKIIATSELIQVSSKFFPVEFGKVCSLGFSTVSYTLQVIVIIFYRSVSVKVDGGLRVISDFW